MKKSQAERNHINSQKGVLDQAQVLRIKAALAGHARPSELAILYGVSVETIRRIDRGDTWAWLTAIGDAPVDVSETDKADAAASFAKLNALMREEKASDNLVQELQEDKP